MHQTFELLTKNKGSRKIIISSTPEGELCISTPNGSVQGSLSFGMQLYDCLQKYFEEHVRDRSKKDSVDFPLFRRYDWIERI